MNRELVEGPTFNEPIIEPEQVAEAVVNQVLSGKSGQIILPQILGIATGIKGFPFWLQEMIRSSKANTLKNITI